MSRVMQYKIFDSPIYECMRAFIYLWKEMQLPISYKDNRRGAERILLDVAQKRSNDIALEAIAHFGKLVGA